jgi:hypothetical protein
MKARLIGAPALGASLVILAAAICTPGDAVTQSPPQPNEINAPQPRAGPTPEQLDQLTAPIALYPDPLLADMLMAAGYPLEVVEADRWLQNPANAALRGGDLTAALAPIPWDPSIKSLIAFPRVVTMMDQELDWTEALGEAFAMDQGAVMDAIQRLRQRARASGRLHSTPQEIVADQGDGVTIEPADPDEMYAPVYEPVDVFGPWPDPDYPPYYFPDAFSGAVVGDDGFGWWGFTVIAPLWGWNHWDWRRHHIIVDPSRFAELNRGRPPPGASWTHDHSHRKNVPYQAPDLRGRFSEETTYGASDLHGYGAPTDTLLSARRLSGPVLVRPSPLPSRPMPPPRSSPVLQSYGPRIDIEAAAARGRESRMSMPTFHSPSGGHAPTPSSRGPHR